MNPVRSIALCILTVFTLIICCPLLFYISNYYTDFIWFLYRYENKSLIDNWILALLFNGGKVFCIPVFIWIARVWFDFFNDRKRKATIGIMNIAGGIMNSLSENRRYFLSLEKKTRFVLCTILIIQFLAYFYFLLAMPLQYDEWFSYRYYSRNGFWVVLSDYHVPNNHILYNLIAALFIKSPFDIEITMRLPSLAASMITTWYFFKLCRPYFKSSISALLLIFVLTSYPVIMYSFEARGYSFVNLFCVLLMYFSSRLNEDYTPRKYRAGLIIALWLGLWSVPTFIYTALPVVFVLVLYILFQKKTKAFILLLKDVFVSAVLVISSYLFVLLFNNSQKLFNPNNGNTLVQKTHGTITERIFAHLKSVCAYLFYREQLLPVISALALISVALYLYERRNRSFLPVLSIVMFFSPLALLLLHRVIPFDRSWLFLIFPAAICLGCGVEGGLELLYKKVPSLSVLRKLSLDAVFLALMVFLLARFPSKHEHFARMDFAVEDLSKKHINAVAGNIREIGLTGKDDEYYPADLIWNYCLKLSPERNVKIEELREIGDQDILIVHKSKLNNFKDKLAAYKLLLEFDERIFIYGKSSLF